MKYFTILFLLTFLLSGSIVKAETGIASIFCDRVTASGEMHCSELEAAHRTRRLGSSANVCTGSRCITLRIVDRGPFIRSRIIDLSPGAARALSCNGLCRVTVH